MDTGAAGPVMPAEMFPRVIVDRTTATKNFVAANGETIKYLGGKPYHSSPWTECTGALKIRSASVVKSLISIRKVVQAGSVAVLDDKNPHIRNNRDGTATKLDVNNGVYTMGMWVCLDETGPVSS